MINILDTFGYNLQRYTIHPGSQIGCLRVDLEIALQVKPYALATPPKYDSFNRICIKQIRMIVEIYFWKIKKITSVYKYVNLPEFSPLKLGVSEARQLVAQASHWTDDFDGIPPYYGINIYKRHLVQRDDVTLLKEAENAVKYWIDNIRPAVPNSDFCNTVLVSKALTIAQWGLYTPSGFDTNILTTMVLKRLIEKFHEYGGCANDPCMGDITGVEEEFTYVTQNVYIGYVYGCMGNFVIEKIHPMKRDIQRFASYIIYKRIRIHPGSQIVVFIPGIGYVNTLPKIDSESSGYASIGNYKCRRIFVSQKLPENPICECPLLPVTVPPIIERRLSLDDNISDFFYPSDLIKSEPESETESEPEPVPESH